MCSLIAADLCNHVRTIYVYIFLLHQKSMLVFFYLYAFSFLVQCVHKLYSVVYNFLSLTRF